MCKWIVVAIALITVLFAMIQCGKLDRPSSQLDLRISSSCHESYLKVKARPVKSKNDLSLIENYELLYKDLATKDRRDLTETSIESMKIQAEHINRAH